MKYAGIVLIFMTSVMTGNYLADRYIRRYRILRTIERFIGRAELMVRCTASPVRDIISAAAADDDISRLKFISAVNEALNNESEAADIRKIWNENLKIYRPPEINDEEYSVLEDMGKMLGAADVQGQLQCFELYSGIIGRSITDADRERREKPKLFRSMGILAGMLAAIILI